MKRIIESYLNATKEILWSWCVFVFLSIDIIGLLQQEIFNGFKIKLEYFMLVLVVGIVFSSIKVVVDKNKKIDEFKKNIGNPAPVYNDCIVNIYPPDSNNPMTERKSPQKSGDTSIIKQ